ncbi:hypothetical protein M569_12912 [Genlisea aurea]|uniref:C2 domain-containing protein n=1 Tax=Genlisea aurea TaxID=192259 RepID=S8CBX8_9LAMI|nr:hypothetical protein M569_12912 [Genlisea aurea]
MKLLVSIIEAKNIPALDPNGFCDPYVKLKLGRQRFKSKVVKKCLNPSWNEDATFKVDDLNKKLKISVLDENYFSDDCIGWIKVSIGQLFDAKDQSLGTAWYKLHPKNKKARNKDCDITSMSSGSTDASEDESETWVDHEQQREEQPLSVDFEELIRCMETKEQEDEIPNPLSGGTVVECLYEISPKELNSLLFSPESDFTRSYADMLGSTDLKMDSWKIGDALKRTVSYTKPASKLVKALKASEEQTYLKADGSSYVILSTVSTPDAPCGKTFRTEILYLITSGPEQLSGAPSSRLVVSWRINFLQSTMLRSMIENGARQGIKESFGQYEILLSQRVKPLDHSHSHSTPDANPLLVAVEAESESILKLAVEYFWNITTISALLMLLYMLTHMWLVAPNTLNGLEFVGLDLPDSISELIVCLALVLQGKRVLEFISRFMRARLRKGCDNGIKAQGTGWLLTVALIEGSNLATIDSNGLSNPFVIFTCNGKSRTSSVKFHRSDPLWNEIFEFDAMDEPPSILEIQVLGFDGRFNEAPSFGNAEINFLKSNISDLSDIWIPLRGQLAQACHSKLHIRIFLNNTKGTNAVKDYLAKVEKEVGKKVLNS